MKTLIATLIVTLLGSAALASGCSWCDNPFVVSSILTSAGPASTSGRAYDKSALEMAQEDAVKFVANKGAGNASQALRAAINEVNAKLAAAGIEALSDLDAANMVVFVNTINSQKQ